jgi:hypothetical protein
MDVHTYQWKKKRKTRKKKGAWPGRARIIKRQDI